MTGRTVIYTDESDVTVENVFEVLQNALATHNKNSQEINYLYGIYKGKQDILQRVKEVRPEINNKVVVNRANEIVAFKTGYLMGEPVQYVNNGGDEANGEAIKELNTYMELEGKSFKDKELSDWMHIAGTAYRICKPRSIPDEGEAPFEFYTLDPRYCFVIYHSGLGHKPVAGVKFIQKTDGTTIYSLWTKNYYFEIKDDVIVKYVPTYYNQVPIIEYPLNTARLGAFEVVLPLLDAINETESDRLNGIQQFVQAFMVLKNCQMTEEEIKTANELKAVMLPDGADIEMLVNSLDQQQTQTLVDNLYREILEICGMPSMSDGSTSDSSNNGAVILKQGWTAAEARAKSTEAFFDESEKIFLRMVLRILRDTAAVDPPELRYIDIRFTRRNYENISTKADVLIKMLSSDKIAPQLAFVSCGLFPDGELAYQQSLPYIEAAMKRLEENTNKEDGQNADPDAGDDPAA